MAPRILMIQAYNLSIGATMVGGDYIGYGGATPRQRAAQPID